MNYPVIDLHSDLLSFLAKKENRSTDDPLSRNSFPQMLSGRVVLQTLAIFAATSSHSVDQGKQQFSHLRNLFHSCPHRFVPLTKTSDLVPSKHVHLIAGGRERLCNCHRNRAPFRSVFST